jgi:micrococcal nuclease
VELPSLPVVAVVALLAVGAGCLGVPSDPGATDGTGVGTAPGPTLEPGAGVAATVVRVVDGDTVEAELENGSVEKIRLVGVDTPEVFSENTPDEYGAPDTDAGRSCLRGWGERASEFATDELAGRSVRLAFDDNLPRRGYYGRLLAYVYVDGRSFNHRLIASGHARVFRSEFTRREDYEATQRTAREEGRGLWECAEGVATTGASATPGGTVVDVGLAVADLQADAPGNDNDNLGAEYVTFENRGTERLDLSGWTVRDEADHVYAVPEGTVLEPGGRITLYTGSGTDGDGALYWGRNGAVWNNGGDVVVVVDDEGRTVLREPY